MSSSIKIIDVLAGGNGGGGGGGTPGAPAGFGTLAATIDDDGGAPAVDVQSSGPNTAKNITWNFHNIKGADGTPGLDGVNGQDGTDGRDGLNGTDGTNAGFGVIDATVDAGTGTPVVTVTTSGPDTAKNIRFEFKNLKGEQGQQGIQGPEGPAGPGGQQAIAALNPRGDYDAAAAPTYVKNDYISYNGSSYTCKVDNPTNAAPTTGRNDDPFWQLIALQGAQGNPATVTIGNVTELPSGSVPTITNTGTPSAAVLDFGIPAGPEGPQGKAATVTVGTVTGLRHDDQPTVTNSGTADNAILDFGIPEGSQGIGGSPFWNWAEQEDMAQHFKPGNVITANDIVWISDRYCKLFVSIYNATPRTMNAGLVPFDSIGVVKPVDYVRDGVALRFGVEMRPGDKLALAGVSTPSMPTVFNAWAVPPGSYAVPFIDWQSGVKEIDKTQPYATTTNGQYNINVVWYESPENCAISIAAGVTATAARFVIVRPSGSLADEESFNNPIPEKTLNSLSAVNAGLVPNADHNVIYARKGEVFGIGSYTRGMDIQANIAWMRCRPLFDGNVRSFIGDATSGIPNWGKQLTLSPSVKYPVTVTSIFPDATYTFYGASVEAPCDGYISLYVSNTRANASIWTLVKPKGSTIAKYVDCRTCPASSQSFGALVKAGDTLYVAATTNGYVTLGSTNYRLAVIDPIIRDTSLSGCAPVWSIDEAQRPAATEKRKTTTGNEYTGYASTPLDEDCILSWVITGTSVSVHACTPDGTVQLAISSATIGFAPVRAGWTLFVTGATTPAVFFVQHYK